MTPASTLTSADHRKMPGMAQFLAHPLRLTAAGTFATVDDTADEFLGQAVHVIEATRLGERPMAPGFGVPEAVWAEVRESDVQAVLDQYGPAGVEVLSVESTQTGPQETVAAVTWARNDL